MRRGRPTRDPQVPPEQSPLVGDDSPESEVTTSMAAPGAVDLARANETAVATRAVIFDVDGVVSAVHPQPGSMPWGDERVVGYVFGDVLMSPTLRSRLDALGRVPNVSCWWLTSWSAEMRGRMCDFPGAEWSAVAEPHLRPDPSGAVRKRTWWKLDAVESWLDHHPEIGDVAWCDDHLRGGRAAAVRRRLTARGLDAPLILAPPTTVGLAPRDLERLEAWCARAGASTRDHDLR